MDKKKHIKLVSVIFLLSILTLTGFSAQNVVQSKWTTQPITVDGLDDEWKGDEMATEKKVQVDFAVRNDAQNMYVLFIFKDPKFLSSISATGITLYYNTEGKKKKDHAFHFSNKKVTGEELLAYLKKRGEVLTEQQMQSIIPTNTYRVYMTERTGKKDKEISITEPIPAGLNPGFKINKKGDNFIYEFRVPLIKSEISPRGMGIEPGQSLKIGFEWGGMTEALMKRLRAQSGGRDDISSESRAGSVIDSSRGGTTGAPRSASGKIPKKHAFWIDIKLAQGQ